MHWDQLDDVRDTLESVLVGKLCVRAWIGIGQVLFLDFGESVMPATPPGERYPLPEYELQIDSAYWWLEDASGVRGSNMGSRQVAEMSAGLLVGRRIIKWRFTVPVAALEIIFEGGLILKMSRYSDQAPGDDDAWIIRVPIYYGYMKWDGTFGVGRRDQYFTEPHEPGNSGT